MFWSFLLAQLSSYCHRIPVTIFSCLQYLRSALLPPPNLMDLVPTIESFTPCTTSTLYTAFVPHILYSDLNHPSRENSTSTLFVLTPSPWHHDVMMMTWISQEYYNILWEQMRFPHSSAMWTFVQDDVYDNILQSQLIWQKAKFHKECAGSFQLNGQISP